MFCTQCGQQNPDDSRFCSRCGNALQRPGGEVPVDTTSTISLSALEGLEAEPGGGEGGESEPHALEALPSGSALLVVKRGPNAGSRFLLDAAGYQAHGGA